MVDAAVFGKEQFTAFNAFENQLKTLCLNEFPCGIGTWREGYSTKKRTVHKKDLENINTKHSVTLKDYGTQFEKADHLERLTKDVLSPWSQDYSWSTEAKELRQIAVKSPWLLDEAFVLSHFKTLRIIDKGVTELDENLLRLKSLEELTISANQLETLDSRNLPPSLKVLEACANRITDLVDLCVTPPPLLHLGVGHNNISIVEDYISSNYWPALLSLDLSYNNLADLLDIVRKLGTLPKLRNLVLIGNPLSLVPGYRGYIIDSLRSLSSLDDEVISADVKHHFKGLARRREYIVDEARIYLRVNYIRNLPVPEEMKTQEELPEWPLITRKWYVQFTVPRESTPVAEVLDADVLRSPDGLGDSPDEEGMENEQGEQSMHLSSGSLPPIQETEAEAPAHVGNSEAVAFADQFTVSQQAVFDASAAPVMVSIKSQEITQWVEEEMMDWECRINRDDLVALRDFLQEGMKVEVIEEKTESYPVDQGEDAKGDKKSSDKAKEERKPHEPPQKDAKKKRKEVDVELRHEPPTVSYIGSWVVPLSTFMDGNYEISEALTQDLETAPSTLAAHDDKKDKKKSKDEKKKPGSAKKDGKSPLKQTKESTAKKASGENHDGEDELPAPPLQIEIAVRLHHWTTAMDSVRDEEERIRLLEEQRLREEAEAAEAAAAVAAAV